MTFGETLKNLRLGRAMTLRAFCAEVGAQPGNYSKMESGLVPAPKDEDKLKLYLRALRLEAGRPEWREIIRLAAISRGEIPQRVLINKEAVRKLPSLFRALEGDAALDEAALDELVAVTRRE